MSAERKRIEDETTKEGEKRIDVGRTKDGTITAEAVVIKGETGRKKRVPPDEGLEEVEVLVLIIPTIEAADDVAEAEEVNLPRARITTATTTIAIAPTTNNNHLLVQMISVVQLVVEVTTTVAVVARVRSMYVRSVKDLSKRNANSTTRNMIA